MLDAILKNNFFSDILARMALCQRDYAIAQDISARKLLVAHGTHILAIVRQRKRYMGMSVIRILQ